MNQVAPGYIVALSPETWVWYDEHGAHTGRTLWDEESVIIVALDWMGHASGLMLTDGRLITFWTHAIRRVVMVV